MCTTSTSVMFVVAARSASTLTARQTLRRGTAHPTPWPSLDPRRPLNVSTLTASADHDAPLERIPRSTPLGPPPRRPSRAPPSVVAQARRRLRPGKWSSPCRSESPVIRNSLGPHRRAQAPSRSGVPRKPTSMRPQFGSAAHPLLPLAARPRSEPAAQAGCGGGKSGHGQVTRKSSGRSDDQPSRMLT